MLMLDVSEEQIMGINVVRSFMFRESLLHYTPSPVRLIKHSTLNRKCKGKSTSSTYEAAQGV